MPRHVIPWAVPVVLCLAACAAGGADAPASIPPASTSTSLSRPTTPSATATSVNSAQTAVTKANDALVTSLAELAGRSRALSHDTGLRTIRAAVAQSGGKGRTALSAVRSAAYPGSTRSCTRVRQGQATASAAAREVAQRAAGLDAAVARISSEQDNLRSQRNLVATQLKALVAALKTDKDASTVTVNEVQSALQATDSLLSSSAADVAQTRNDVAKAVADAAKVSAKAAQIVRAVC